MQKFEFLGEPFETYFPYSYFHLSVWFVRTFVCTVLLDRTSEDTHMFELVPQKCMFSGIQNLVKTFNYVSRNRLILERV